MSKTLTFPVVTLGSGASIRIISGEVNGEKGPVTDIVIDPEYLDVTVRREQVSYMRSSPATLFLLMSRKGKRISMMAAIHTRITSLKKIIAILNGNANSERKV